MNVLGERLAALIAAQGPISVAEFMAQANGAYYATRDPLGTGGDFTTAPEISQMFGELLGLWCVQIWHDQGRPSPTRLVELGPGRGTLLADALRAMQVAPALLGELDVVLVEASPALKAIQQQRLARRQVAWTNRFDETTQGAPVFVLANEFFDALPIRQFVKAGRGWHEHMIGLDTHGSLAFVLSPVPNAALGADAPDGAVLETSAPALALAEEIGRVVAARGGAALIVDYGYDRPRFAETLQAVASHAFAAVLDAPGETDLSAHVDFASLKAAAALGGAAAYGPVAQGALLENLGIHERAERLAMANPESEEALAAAVARLTQPDQMGTLFKALAVVPQGAPAPPGF